jgi:hypothetical protein
VAIARLLAERFLEQHEDRANRFTGTVEAGVLHEAFTIQPDFHPVPDFWLISRGHDPGHGLVDQRRRPAAHGLSAQRNAQVKPMMTIAKLSAEARMIAAIS